MISAPLCEVGAYTGHVAEVRITRLGDVPLPTYASADAAGLDLCAAAACTLAPGDRAVVPCGIAIALPAGFEAQVRPRSGLAANHGVTLLNSPGTIDADYRGEIKVVMINHGCEPFVVERGMRVAQLVVAPVSRVEWREVGELPPTRRGDGGFGSTGSGAPPPAASSSE